ncbi:kelch domain containing 7A [Willisornis vidua]|uniref:Kelch domain containing 7A n=1 Tax=Willisornis vidua TaxID=1566151 RepID=A0ABQ9DSE4_9PASS|nr:kelch domain containing 7A [Willisornis vidua]
MEKCPSGQPCPGSPVLAALSWQSDMQLAGKLVLSAAALLLLTLAYRFYRSRSLAGGNIPLAEEGEHRENDSRDGDGDGDDTVGLRRRRVVGEEVKRDGGDAAGSIPGTRHTLLRGHPGVPRREEEEEEEGEEMVSEPGLTRRRALARGESEVGSELGYKLGSKSESKAGIEPGSDSSVELGSELGNELRNELGSEPGRKLGSKSGSKLGNNPGNEPGRKLGSRLGNELGSELTREPGIKLGSDVESKPGSKHRSSKRVKEELQSFATQNQDPALATCDPTTPSTVPPSTRSLETSPEPPSPGRKNSILQIADSPHLQLPMEGFGAGVPPASPQPGPVATPDPFQLPPHTQLDLGNCYEVLSRAKAQKLRPLQEAAYKVMSDNYLQVLRTPSIYGRLNAGERELILRRRMKGKMYMVVADINLQEPNLHPSRLCYYDEGGDCWHHLCHVPPEVVSRGCAMCSMFNYLFVVAGCKGTGRAQRPSNCVFCYDPLTNIWREICPLNQARPHCKLVALDGHLYAIGGECLSTVERYDPRQDRWAFVAPLPHDTFAVAHTATVCDGEIYITGGTLRYVLLRYDPRLDSWSASPAIGSKDRTAEMVSANGFIYRFDLHHSTGVSAHRCGAKAKLWYECATYTLPDLSGFQCAVVGSLVHLIGRRFHIRFLADPVSPRFGAKELQPFPSPHGSLLPAVLVLPEEGLAQTQV